MLSQKKKKKRRLKKWPVKRKSVNETASVDRVTESSLTRNVIVTK